MLTKESLIAWAADWVHDETPGQRARFVEGLTKELENWEPPPPKKRGCKHCPFWEYLHDGQGTPAGCPGFEFSGLEK
jgi:hypothetical protein